MSIHDSQPREDNGQYGPKDHSYPEVVLAESVDGSFLFPPSEWPGGAAQYIEFWKTQPISDEALTNFASCYAAEWDEWALPLIREHLETWGNGEEARQQRRTISDPVRLRDLRLAEYERYKAQLKSTRPDRIPTGFARQIARAAQIVHNRSHLREERDREAALEAVVHHTQNGEPVTAVQFWDAYRLHEIMPDAFYSRENAVLRALRSSR